MDSPGVGDDESPDDESDAVDESPSDASPDEPTPESRDAVPDADRTDEPDGATGTPTADDGSASTDPRDGRVPDPTGDTAGSGDDFNWNEDGDAVESSSRNTPTSSSGQSSDRGTVSGDSSVPLDENERGDRLPDADETTGGTWWLFARDIVSSALAVVLVGALLFAVSGVWPPMVAIESPSMTPNMQTGDLVFVMDEERFPGEGAQGDTGVVTANGGATDAADYRQFGNPGDVIVYNPDGNTDRTPIIHRAMFWVEEGENWYDEADRQSVGRYDECGDSADEAMPNCPAPHDGFVTKGDANSVYDQVQGLSGPVRPAWVVGTAELRIPVLGCVRLRTEGCADGLFGFAVPDASASSFERSCWCEGNATATTAAR